MNLSIEIGGFLKRTKKGTLLAAPCDVYLDEHSNVVQPDLVVVLQENHSMVKDYIKGTPDLIIEILSPGSYHYDTGKKKELYERFGVKEYWLIDPATQEATGFELKGKYIEIGRFNGKISSKLLSKEFSFES
ncbi:Uma2 family endonuclease [Chryseosolibacter indicus]|uniref:Uma2 family endonuclease n=1 Tax=Chryseosolibacter indicus TaxID=2782351 RepID=A0ABS5VY43_9BACT|nr:Uma2 family endonuclease [Chryseosolibacter indicus]MBT1706323.1 Uma2 family endonuclease [Chryseosolibacter indicus]